MGYFEDIWLAVLRIPRGKVATYGTVARAAGHPGTARQVAWALRAGGPAELPWHRVVGGGGKILLPGESGERQRALLEAEGVRFAGLRVDMRECGMKSLRPYALASRSPESGTLRVRRRPRR